MATRRRHLRLVAEGERCRPDSRPAPVLIGAGSEIDAALTTMRLCAAVLEAQPADLFTGYTQDETTVQVAAAERMTQTFRVLDKLLTDSAPRKKRVSESRHLPHEESEK